MSLRRVAIACSLLVFLIAGLNVCLAGEWTDYDITVDTVWDPSENPIVLTRDLRVHSVNPDDPADRVKLIIKPGVVVKLGLHVDVFIEGVVIAEEALFTSVNDDSTPDGAWEDSTGEPQIGDWNSIHIYHHDIEFNACTFRYGRSIEIEDCSPYLFGNRIEKFSRYGLYVIAHDNLVSPTLRCNTFADIGEPYTDNNPANGKYDPGLEDYQDLDMNNQYDAGVAIYCYTPPYSYGPCVPLIEFNDIIMSNDPNVARGGLPIVFENTLPILLPDSGQNVNPIPDGNLIRQRIGDTRFVSSIGVKGYVKPGEQIDGTGNYKYTEYFLPLVDDRAVASIQVSAKNQHLPFTVLEDLIIADGCSLEICPSCVIKFCADTSLEILGTTITSDQTAYRCYLTSLHNDVHGLPVPGSNSIPAPGDWNIFRICCEECTIENCDISYGTSVKIDQCSPTFINNQISSNYMYGLHIYAEADPARPEISRNTIRDCGHVVDAANAICEGGGICLETGRDYLGPCEPILQSNNINANDGYPLTLLGTCDPEYINNTLQGNYYRAVGIGGTIRGRGATWGDVTGYFYPYVVIDPVVIAGGERQCGLSTAVSSTDPLDGVKDILVDESADWKRNVLTGSILYPNTDLDEHFTIVSNTRTSILVGSDMSEVAQSGDPYEIVVEDTVVDVPQGTVIKMAQDMSIFVKGKFQLHGTTRDRVQITSFNDDTVGGSVLQSGATPMPHPGDWRYIKYENDNNKLEECVLKYGTSIYIDSCAPLLQHNAIVLFADAGILCYAHTGMASPQILNNAIMCNLNGVVCQTDEGFADPNGAQPVIHSNDIVNNDNYGVVNINQPGAIIDARDNWWGETDGPSGDADGHGDAISGVAMYEPWQTVQNFGTDADAPVFENIFPDPFSVDVSTNTLIMLDIVDADTGVNPNSISIRVEHQDGAGYVYVMKDGEDQAYNGGSVMRSSITGGYRYTYVPGHPFAADNQICVMVEACDMELCPNWQDDRFCFRTGRSIGLSFGRVEPEIGTTKTQFTYSVDFFDRDLVSPQTALVYIDGSPRNMTLSAGDPWEGTFSYTTSLKVGYHTFWFEFVGALGAGEVRLPEVDDTPPYLYGPTVISEESTSSWPMFRHDPEHSGSSPVTATTAPTLNWSFTAGGYIISSPVVGPDNIVYFGCYDGNVYAMNTDGTVKWAASTGDYIASSPALTDDGILYIGSGDQYFYAFDQEDGALSWSYKTGGVVDSSPVIGIDGNIYFGCSDGYLYSMTAGGELRWRFGTGSWVTSSPAIWYDGTVYFGSDDHYLNAVRHDGTLRWSFDAGDVITSSPAVGPDQTVYFGTMGNRIIAVNSDGTLKWNVYASDIVHSSPALSPDGVLYVGSYDHKLYAIEAETGVISWTSNEANNRIHTSPAIDGAGNILFGSHDGNLYCLGKDGSLLWRFYDPVRPGYGFAVHSSPAIGPDGSVYFGSEEKFYALKQLTADNTGPTLSDANCGPASRSGHQYSFSIHYMDKELDPPGVAKVIIDGAEYELSLLSGETANGYYAATVKLTPGEHTHYFFFADTVSKTARYPAVGVIEGPAIEDSSSGTSVLRSTPPKVWMAGYYGSYVSERLGGKLHVVAYCTDVDQDIVSVDLCYDGKPLNVQLKDDGASFDGLAGDGIYACHVDVQRGLKAGKYLFEIVATDADGNRSNVWPYITVDDYPELQRPMDLLGDMRGSLLGGSSPFADGGATPSRSRDINLQNYIMDAIRGIPSREYLGNAPEILLAGFGCGMIDHETGGKLSINVIVNDPDGGNSGDSIASVVASSPAGGLSFDSLDKLTSDGNRSCYGTTSYIPGGAARGLYVVEIQATDEHGNPSSLFPYFVVAE